MKIEIEEIDIDRLKASPTQPRQHFDEQQQAELTSSIKQHGFTMSALLVRPWPNGNGAGMFEIVAGERRFRAARSAGVNQVPCIVRELNDQEVLEQQLIENIQRADLTPIEEAHHYKRLLAMRADGEKPLYTIESLASRVGKEPRTVREKVQLCVLPDESRAAVESGRLPWKTAVLIARIPAGAMRAKAEKLILHPQHEEGPLSNRRALEVIHREFIRDLRTAQFDQEDPQLVPVEIVDGERVAGGACTDCPMRQMTGPDATAVGGSGRQYVCTQPSCFERKQSGAWKQWQQKQTNVEQGRRATTEEESYRLYPTGNQLSPMFGLVDLAQRPDGDDLRAGVDAPGTWRQLTEGRGLQVIVSRDRLRKEHELVEREKAIEAAKLNGHTGIWKTTQREKPKRDDERKAEEKSKTETNEHKKEAVIACFDLVNARAKSSHMAGLVALVIQREIDHSKGHEEFFKRHKLPIGGSVLNQLRKRPLAELVAMLVEFVVAEGGYTYEYHPDDKPWLALFDIDYAQVEKRFTAAETKAKKKVAK